MGNLFDWLEWRGDISFRQVPFGEVDNLALSVLAYVPLEGMVPSLDSRKGISIREASALFFRNKEALALLRDEKDKLFLQALAASERFGPLEIFACESCLDSETETQFAAFTIDTGDRHLFLAFRGTDPSLIGWKENFNMCFMQSVPSQRAAVRYVEALARMRRGRLRLGGHSKGGNLAVYAAAFAPHRVQRRIASVWNNDGPGFNAQVVKSKGYLGLRRRMFSFIPQSSVVGMLLEHEEAFAVVRSTQTGILQHDPYSWTILGAFFERMEELDPSSLFIDRTLKDWLISLDESKRETVIEALYEVVLASEAKTVGDLASNGLKKAGAILKRFGSFDTETRDMLFEAVALLFKAASKNMSLAFKDRSKERNAKISSKYTGEDSE